MKLFIHIIPILITLSGAVSAFEKDGKSLSRTPTQPIFAPGPEYGPLERKYQGIPTIERAPNGRLWAAWYAGPVHEDRYNYVVLVTSGDDGETWTDLKMVIDPDGAGPVRASDPCLWLDPFGKLWLFWFQNPDNDINPSALFFMTTENPGDADPLWSEPQFVCDGIMMNKPTVLSNGDWLLPTALWWREGSCRVVVSSDRGATWQLRGTATVPRPEDRHCDEPMIVERRDGSLWMLVRTSYGIGETISIDRGRSWTPVAPTALPHSPSRFFVRRLDSGRLLLVKHGPLVGKPVGRKQLTAYLSDDDGRSWKGGLMLDERAVSYPDGTQAEDGKCYLIYDHNRMDKGQILMATFYEDDVIGASLDGSEGKESEPIPDHQGIQNIAFGNPSNREKTRSARYKIIVNQATGVNTKPWLKDGRFLRPRDNEDGEPLQSSPFAELELAQESGEVRPLGPVEQFLRPPQGEETGLHVVESGLNVFQDREEAFNVVPDELVGMRYILAPVNGTAAVCRTGGVVYVLAPQTDRNRESGEELLHQQGFVKTALPEFVLFLSNDGRALAENLYSVFQKTVEPGETVQTGPWGVIVY
jgi:predicted neuraminidase